MWMTFMDLGICYSNVFYKPVRIYLIIFEHACSKHLNTLSKQPRKADLHGVSQPCKFKF